MSSKLSWFVTENGRKFVFGSICATSISLIGIKYLPHTIFLDKYKEFVQCYSSGIERPVPNEVLEKYNKAVEILNVPEKKRKFLKPFTVFGFDVFSAGSTYSRNGALIGLPVNFSYLTDDGINKGDITVNNESVAWNSEDGKKLAKALVLTEDEQVFAIVRELLTVDTAKLLLDTIYPAACLLFTYTLAGIINTNLNLYERPRSLRLIMYSIVGTFGFGLYCFAKDFTQVYYETEVDKKMVALGPEMVKSGVSFYDKMLLRNVALRNLMQDERYTALGNENFFLRWKRVPITMRKAFFEEQLEKLPKDVQ